MPRDYKHRATAKSRSRKSSPWVWLLAGLAIGFFAAFLVYLNMRPQSPSVPAKPAALPEVEDTRDVRKTKPKQIPPPPKPRFDFYNLLPEMEVVIPEQEITGKKKEGVKQVEKPGTYLLQAGSFRGFEQADQLRAKLALLGLETSIQTIDSNGSSWHRVRVGPYKNLQELNKARVLLIRNGIEAILIKLKNK